MAKKSTTITAETEQRIRMLIDEAIKLYSGNFGEVIKRAIDGTLHIQKYKKTNNLLSELGKIQSLVEPISDSDSREVQVIKSNLLRLTEYIDSVKRAGGNVESNLTKPLQELFGSGALIVDSRVQYAVVLLELVDSEMKKAEQIAKIGGKSVEEIARGEIVDKVLSSYSVYEGADFKALTPYLNNALTGVENVRYIEQIDAIYRMNRCALTGITELERLRIAGTEKLRGTTTQVDEEYKERHTALAESLIQDDFYSLIDKSITSIMDIMYDKNLSLEESLKAVEAKTKKATQAVNKFITLGEPLLLAINQFTVSINEYLKKFTEAISDENIASIVSMMTDGRSRLTDATVYKDMREGVEESQHKPEIFDVMSDEELLKIMFGTLLKSPMSIRDRYHAETDKIPDENLVEEFMEITAKYNDEINSWLESFDADYSDVVEGYCNFVLYRQKIESLAKICRTTNGIYVQKFNPIGRTSGLPYFSEKQLESLKTAMLQTMNNFDGDKKEQWYKNLAVTFAYSIYNYFRDLPIGRDEAPVCEYVDIQNRETSIAEVFEPIIQIVEGQISDNDTLANKFSGTEDLFALAKNPRYAKMLNVVMDYAQIELMSSAFALIEELHEMRGDEDDYTAKLQLLADIYDASGEVKAVCGERIVDDETYYKYLVDKIYETISLSRQISAKDKLIGRTIERDNPRRDLTFHINLFYNNLMEKLYHLENIRAHKGLSPSDKALGLIGEMSKRVDGMFKVITSITTASSNPEVTSTLASFTDLFGSAKD